MKDKKKWVIGILCTLVCIMAVGYAVLAQQLNITGTTSIDSTWKVEITNIQESEVVGKALSKVTPSYTSTTASFNVGLIQPGDSITYDIEISNLGTLKAKVDSININLDENDAIKYTTSGVSNGDKLGVGEKTTLTIKVEYDSSVTSQPAVTTKDITVTINYVQDLDEGNTSTAYQTYSIGDQITFAGSNWYVIKNSSSEEDYVTLMKEKVLTNKELGEYGIDYEKICSVYEVEDGTNGCTTEGQKVTIPYDTMSYYWSDTCHETGSYGYTDTVDLGCEGHNDYEGSKIKEYLEGIYINTLGSNNLKEVDGYKIRLIRYEELMGDLGYTMDITSGGAGEYPDVNDNVPTWVYQNFGEGTNIDNNVYGYWTMTEYSSGVWRVYSAGLLSYHSVYDNSSGVRPVINLLKSSI